MTSDERKAILETYGKVVLDPYVIRPSVMWLVNCTGQNSCNGTGMDAEHATDSLYRKTYNMLKLFVEYIERPDIIP